MERCGTSLAAVVIMVVPVALYFVIRGTHRLIQWLALRAGVRSRDKASFVGFCLTPLILTIAFVCLHYALRAGQGP